MTDNLITLRKEDLESVITKIIGQLVDKSYIQSADQVYGNEYYTRNQLCDKLHISYTTLWRMEKKGFVSAFKIGRKNLYSKREVMSLLHQGITL